MESKTSIFSLLHTVVDRAACLAVLDRYESGLFSQMKTPADECFTPFFQEHLGEGPEARKKIAELRAQVLQAPIVRLTLAFTPDDTFVSQLSSAVRSLTKNETTLLDISSDEQILAGVVLSDAGKLLDYSLAKKLQELDWKSVASAHLPSLKE